MRKRLLSALLASCMVLTPLSSTALAWDFGTDNGIPVNAKSFYDKFVEHIDDVKDGKPILLVQTSLDNETLEDKLAEYEPDIKAAAYAFNRDYPEYFWLKSGVATRATGNPTAMSVEIFANITVGDNWMKDTIDSDGKQIKVIDPEQIAQDQVKVTEQVNRIAQQAAQKATVEEKLRYVHDWLTQNNKYNNDAAKDPNYSDARPWSALSALDTNLSPVCEGYSRAFKLVCDKMKADGALDDDFDCILVSGQGNGGDHMWNYVMIDGKWYIMDVTFDDPTPDRGENATNYTYFLIGSEDSTYKYNHTIDDEFTYPTPSTISYSEVVADQENEVDPASIRLTATPIVFGESLKESGLQNDGPVRNKNGGTLTGKWTWQNDTVVPDAAGTFTEGVAVFTYGDRTYTQKVSVEVQPRSLTATEVTVDSIADVVFNEEPQTPAVTVKDGTRTLVKDTDYTVTYTNNTNAGTATVTITGSGNYKDTKTTTFEIKKALIADLVALGTKTARVSTESQTITLSGLPDADFSAAAVEVEGDDIFAAPPVFNSDAVRFTLKEGVAEGAKADLTITGTSNNYDKVPVTVTIEVRDKSQQTPELVISGSDSVTMGETLTLTVSGGADIDTPITWTVSPSTAATLSPAADSSVTLTPNVAGELTVTAVKAGNDDYAEISASKTITVNTAASDLTIQADKTDLNVGETVTLSAIGGAAGDTRPVAWSVSDTDIAQLDTTEGNTVTLTAVAEGTVTVTAVKAADSSYNEASNSVTIHVTKTDSGLSIQADKTDLNVGETVTLSAIGGAAGDTRPVTWSVSNTDAAQLDTTEGNTVTLTAVAEGTVTVTAAKEATNAFDAVSASKTITISKVKQNLTITNRNYVTYGDTLALTADLDGVTWTVTNGTGEATIQNGNILHPTKFGTVTVTATKVGDSSHDTVTQEQEITIYPKRPDTADVPTRPADSTVVITENDPDDYTIAITRRNVTFADLLTILFDDRGVLCYNNGSEVDPDEIIAKDDTYDLRWYPDAADRNIWLDVTIEPEEDEETYYISVLSVENGTVIPSTRHAARSDRVSLSIRPDSGYELDSLIVTDIRGREISTRSSNDDTYSFTMPSSRVTVKAEFTKIQETTPDVLPVDDDIYTQPFTGLGTPGISGIVLNPAPMPFTDVRYTDWFYDNVEYMWKHYLMSGTSDTQFDPNITTSRGMIWTILARMNNVRTDLNPGATWYERGQLWAMQQGVTDGTNPMQEVTREQLVTMLWRNAGSPGYGAADLSQFTDAASVSTYAQSAVRWAVGMGVLTGSDGRIDPQGTATRAQVAAMVARYGDKVS